MLMCLSSLGVLLADALQYTYIKLSCQTAASESATTNSTKVPTLTRQQLQDNSHYRPHNRSQPAACQVANSSKPKVSDTSDQYADNMKLDSCEGCKYDAILNVANTQNDCIYRGHNVEEKSQIVTGHKLYNSTNNEVFVNVPFEQQQQQQQQQPRNLNSDSSIMLMPLTGNAFKSATIASATTATTTSSLYAFNESGTTTTTTSTSTATTTTNHGTQVYVNTPQFFTRPMQTIRIAISPPASNTTTIDENAITATATSTTTLPRFVAVPSSMVRLEQQSLTTSNNCHFILPQPHAHNYTSIVPPPTIYFPMTATSTLPRAALTQTLHRYETLSPQQHVNTTIGATTTTPNNNTGTIANEAAIITFPKAINSPIGTRRTNVLTNPLSPELNALRKTALLVQTSTNGRESIQNTKITNLPTEHALDCKVAIMEDEEENEQKRLGNCPYGTPSRVPLIRNAAGHDNCARNSSVKDNSLKAKRERLGASFHRHTFNTFQRSNSNGIYMKPQSAEVSNSVKRNRKNYCVDVVEGSDDDEYIQHNSSGCYMLNRLDTLADNHDETEEHDTHTHTHTDTPQIPISIVVLLLICYICLGAGIFALWENWSLIDGAYFCFVTLTTIGYGDFVPEHILQAANVHLFTFCAYLLIGLILVAMSLSILETQLLWKCKRIAVRLKLIN